MEMKSKKTAAKFFTKHWITLWIVIVSLLLAVMITAFASYTDTNKRIKRVFVASKQITKLFTSNYLISGDNHKPVCFNPDDTKEFTVFIRNYDPSDPTQVHNGTITYSLNAVLAHNTCAPYTGAESETEALTAWANDGMEILITDGTNTITLSGNTRNGTLNSITLPDTDALSQGSGVRNVHEWTVTFTNIPLDSDYCVTLTATPNDGSGAITSTLAIASYPDTEREGWSCFLSDDTSKDINTFDAFNYMIAGSGGTSLKFSYDATELEINPVFTAYHTDAILSDSYQGSVTGAHTGWKTITIPVVSNVNRYDLQMYKVSSSSPSSWDDLKPEKKNWVEFEIVQPAPDPEPGEGGN